MFRLRRAPLKAAQTGAVHRSSSGRDRQSATPPCVATRRERRNAQFRAPRPLRAREEHLLASTPFPGVHRPDGIRLSFARAANPALGPADSGSSKHSRNRQTLQRMASAETDQNRAGSDIFVGMNPLKDDASSRTKDNLKEIRHVYLDLDENAKAALADIRDSLDAPSPNFVLDTSPGKHPVVWKIEGVDTEQAETLLRSLANRFGGDPAATDAARVLRVPEFVNRKI